MSQSSVTTTPKEPKGFLKKGEGLKRFAAYRPPPPLSTNKIQRRQTFVKFKADLKSKNLNYIYPDLPLYDDSINLSTEIPKIAPPKIMHTPVRPNRKALGTLATPNYTISSDQQPLNSKDFVTPQEKTFTRKVTFMQPLSETPKLPSDGFKRPATPSPVHTPVTQEETTSPDEEIRSPPKRYNLRGSRKTAILSAAPAKENKKSRRQIKAVVERHITPPPSTDSVESSPNRSAQLDHLMNKIQKKKGELSCDSETDEQMVTPDLVRTSPESCISALGQQIRRIESAVNELKREKEYCTCGASTSSRVTRKGTRSKACKDSDSESSTPKIVSALMEEVALLRSKFDEINLRR